jgi:hypothetical protein
MPWLKFCCYTTSFRPREEGHYTHDSGQLQIKGWITFCPFYASQVKASPFAACTFHRHALHETTIPQSNGPLNNCFWALDPKALT